VAINLRRETFGADCPSSPDACCLGSFFMVVVSREKIGTVCLGEETISVADAARQDFNDARAVC
jgi:hypothetical protein